MAMAATTAWKACTVSLTLDSLQPGSVAKVADTRQHALSDLSDGQEVRKCSIGECDATLLTAIVLRDEDRSEPEDGKSVSDDGDASSGECEVRLTSHLPI
jgi:hypothetical protein